MRFEKGHKDATRQRIIETAAARFRQDGVAATGIAGLMAEAGLTHGGFYAHFASKEALVGAAMREALAHSKARTALAQSGLEAYIRTYLRPAHRDAPAHGCVVATLAPEIARHDETTRAGFTDGLRDIFERIEAKLPATIPPEDRPTIAIGIFGVMVGTLQMARTVTDPTLSTQILDSGIAAALALASRQ
jgi:TetR/AcrR family transcriptional repressor of nem operon